MRLDEATDLRADGVRVKELRLGGEVIFRNYPYLRDDFNGAGINTDLWELRDPQGVGGVTVTNGITVFTNDDTTYDGTYAPFLAVISKEAFPVGSRYRVRARNPQGRHVGMIGFCNDPETPFVRGGNGAPGMSWYSRGDIPDNVVASYVDELDNQGYLARSGDYTDWVVLELYRESTSVVKFYENGTLVHTASGLQLANDYKVFFGCDSWSPTTTLEVDWVEVIGPFDSTVS